MGVQRMLWEVRTGLGTSLWGLPLHHNLIWGWPQRATAYRVQLPWLGLSLRHEDAL